jgi:transcriptional regulator with XRE-family HTH domain
MIEEKELDERSPTDLAKDRIGETLARNLHLARKAAKMTQVGLAEASGVARSQITSIEMGDSDPKLSTITALARTLEITPSMLLIDEEELETWLKLNPELAKKLEGTIGTLLSPEEIYEIKRLAQSELRKRQFKAYELEEAKLGISGAIAAAGASAAATGMTRVALGGVVAAAICSPLIPVTGPLIGAALGIGVGLSSFLGFLKKPKK